MQRMDDYLKALIIISIHIRTLTYVCVCVLNCDPYKFSFINCLAISMTDRETKWMNYSLPLTACILFAFFNNPFVSHTSIHSFICVWRADQSPKDVCKIPNIIVSITQDTVFHFTFRKTFSLIYYSYLFGQRIKTTIVLEERLLHIFSFFVVFRLWGCIGISTWGTRISCFFFVFFLSLSSLHLFFYLEIFFRVDIPTL